MEFYCGLTCMPRPHSVICFEERQEWITAIELAKAESLQLQKASDASGLSSAMALPRHSGAHALGCHALGHQPMTPPRHSRAHATNLSRRHRSSVEYHSDAAGDGSGGEFLSDDEGEADLRSHGALDAKLGEVKQWHTLLTQRCQDLSTILADGAGCAQVLGAAARESGAVSGQALSQESNQIKNTAGALLAASTDYFTEVISHQRYRSFSPPYAPRLWPIMNNHITVGS